MAGPASITPAGMLVRFGLFCGGAAACLFGSAGRWDLPFFWAVLGIYAASAVVGARTMDPGLRNERLRPGSGGKDRTLRLWMMPLIVGHWVVAGLDVGRFHWSDTVARVVQVIALIGFASGHALVLWAMRVNRFFSPVVRIQSERGHGVVAEGPYRHVRHPGYLGGLVCLVCGGLALGSGWAMAPLGVCLLMILRRTALEDRFLHEQLSGYTAYAERVRHRLLPGLW